MPMLPVSLPSVWSVPVAIGVPTLLGQSVRHGVQAAASVTLGTVLDDVMIDQAARQWGIFAADGTCVLSAAHVLSVSAESTYQIATAPLEDGSFAAYNKVAMPRLHRVQMVCDGSESGLASSGIGSVVPSVFSSLSGAGELSVRKNFFETLRKLEADLILYSVMTPERTYSHVNITGHRWLRDARHGVTMPVVEIALQEVRVANAPLYTATRQPQGQAMVCGGMVPAQGQQTSQSSMTAAATWPSTIGAVL